MVAGSGAERALGEGQVDPAIIQQILGTRWAGPISLHEEYLDHQLPELVPAHLQALAKDLANIKDTTIYTFLYPILSEDSAAKSRAIWCAKDRAKAWNDWMVDNRAPAAPGKDCQAPIEQLVQLGQANGVQGTPTILFADGGRAPGAVPIAQIEERLARIGRK